MSFLFSVFFFYSTAARTRCHRLRLSAVIPSSPPPSPLRLPRSVQHSSQPAPTQFVILSTASFLIKLCHFTVGVKKRNGLVLSNYRHSYFRRPGCLLRLLLPPPPPHRLQATTCRVEYGGHFGSARLLVRMLQHFIHVKEMTMSEAGCCA